MDAELLILNEKVIDSIDTGLLVLQDNVIVICNAALAHLLKLESYPSSLDTVLFKLKKRDQSFIKSCILRSEGGELTEDNILSIAGKGLNLKALEISFKLVIVKKKEFHVFSFIDQSRICANEIELFETHLLFQAVFDTINEPIFMLDPTDFTLLGSNDAARRTLQIDRSKMKGSPIWDLIVNPTNIERIEEDLKKSKSQYVYNFEMRRPDGKKVPSLHTITKVEDQKGEKIALLWVVNDFSQREYLHQTLAEVENRYRILFNRAGDAIFFVDLESYSIIDANLAAEEMLGFRRTDLINKTMFDLTTVSRNYELMEDFRKLEKLTSITIKGIYISKNGTEIPVQTNMVLTRFGDRNVIIAVSRDISEQLSSERKQLKIEKLEAVRRVTGSIAHEFAQPMQALLTISEIIEQKDEKSAERMLSQIPIIAERMQKLIEQMSGIIRLTTIPYVRNDVIFDLEKSSEQLIMLLLENDQKYFEIINNVAATREINIIKVADYSEVEPILEQSKINILFFGYHHNDVEKKSHKSDLSLKRRYLKIIDFDEIMNEDVSFSQSELFRAIDDALMNK